MTPERPFQPIHLHELSAGQEELALAAMAARGLGGFEDSDEERVYPFNELTRLGFRRAAAMAAELGDSIWARDGCGDSAADHLAAQRREEELIELLRSRPPRPDNPWKNEGLQKLWANCAEGLLFGAMEQLSVMIAPNIRAWMAAAKGAGATRSLPLMASRAASASELPPETLLCCAGSLFGSETLRIIVALPDFTPERFASPWPSPAARLDSRMLDDMAEMGMPAEGWSDQGQWGWAPSPWQTLAESESRLRHRELDCARALSRAGLKPGPKDLLAALKKNREDLADHMELHGARPNAACADASLAKFTHPVGSHYSMELKQPSERLLRWLSEGSIDFLEPSPPVAIGYRGFRPHPLRWAPDLAAVAGRGPETERPRIAQALLASLAASTRLDDPAARKALFTPFGDSADLHNDMKRAAMALGASGSDFDGPNTEARLAAWWESSILNLTAPAAAGPARRSNSL